jgi:hypothetical protein
VTLAIPGASDIIFLVKNKGSGLLFPPEILTRWSAGGNPPYGSSDKLVWD